MIKPESLASIIATQNKHGVSKKELSELFNLQIQTIQHLIELEKDRNIPIEPEVIETLVIDEDIHIDETTAEMYKKYQDGYSLAEVGREYKMSRQAVSLRFKRAKLPARQVGEPPPRKKRV